MTQKSVRFPLTVSVPMSSGERRQNGAFSIPDQIPVSYSRPVPGSQSPGAGAHLVPTPTCGWRLRGRAGPHWLTYQQVCTDQCFLPACWQQLLPPPLPRKYSKRVHVTPRYLCLHTSVVKKAVLSLACLSMKIPLSCMLYEGLHHRQYSSCINHCRRIRREVCTPASWHAT